MCGTVIVEVYAVSLLGTLVFSLLVGSAIGLVRWNRRPEVSRGHPVWALLPWVGGLLGLLLAEYVVSAVLAWVWLHRAALVSTNPLL